MPYSNPIRFPALGISFDPSPIAFSVLGKPIYWYGIIIATGFLLALLYAMKRFKQEGINQDRAIDLILIATPIAIVGARLYYVLFNIAAYDNFFDAIKIWEGGLAIYGGIIAAFLTALIYCRKTGFKFLPFVDIIALSFMIGQAIGRYGNLINREAYGTLCDQFWRMEIYSSYYNARVAVHPTFLYESMWMLLGVILLHVYSKRKKFHGEIFVMYIGWYGLGRGIVEGFRTDSLYVWGTTLRISQLVGFLSFLAAAVFLAYMYKKKPWLNVREETGAAETPDAAKQTEPEEAETITEADGFRNVKEDQENYTEEKDNGDTH